MRTDQVEKTLVKLNKDTKEGKVTWQIKNIIPSSIVGTEKLVDSVYYTTVQGQTLRLFKYQFKNWYEEDHFEFTEAHRLEIVNEFEKTLWQFPISVAVRDLYETVTFKTSNAEDFFTSFLNE